MKVEKIFTPMTIGSCEVANRLVVPAMVTNMCPEGLATERYIRYHEEKAKGGWGLIITEDYRINENAAGYSAVAALYDESQIPSHKELTDRVHKHGSKIFCQIYHAGRQASRKVNGGMQPVSSSAIPCPWNKEVPRELTVEDIQTFVKEFGMTAKNAKAAGFDGIEVHAAHGYLIHEFISENMNHRTDAYGGTYENRLRFLKEIMAEIRKQVGDDYPISVRFSAEDKVSGDKWAESRCMLRDIEAMGADVIHLSNSMYGTKSSVGIVPSFYQKPAWNVALAKEAKSFLKIPVITVGRITDPQVAEDIVLSGAADFIAMGRASLTDPHWPNKAKAQKFENIRHCIGCLQGCTGALYNDTVVSCLVNPELGHESEYDYTPVTEKKKVVVIGAGVAGLEAARGAAIKGHDVTIYEGQDRIGGQFISAAYPPHKGIFTRYSAWLAREIEKYDNITLHLNTNVTVDDIQKANPDKVVLATGAKPIVPDVPGISGENVVFAEDLLLGKAESGQNVLVVGGGMIGTETAAFLGTQVKNKITLVEMKDNIAMDMDPGIKEDLMHELKDAFVDIRTATCIAGVSEKGATLRNNNEDYFFPCDTVVLAIGTRANNKLYDSLKEDFDTVVVGDALQARKALEASAEGFYQGLHA